MKNTINGKVIIRIIYTTLLGVLLILKIVIPEFSWFFIGLLIFMVILAELVIASKKIISNNSKSILIIEDFLNRVENNGILASFGASPVADIEKLSIERKLYNLIKSLGINLSHIDLDSEKNPNLPEFRGEKIAFFTRDYSAMDTLNIIKGPPLKCYLTKKVYMEDGREIGIFIRDEEAKKRFDVISGKNAKEITNYYLAKGVSKELISELNDVLKNNKKQK